jgi:hypothetical protein
MMWSRLKPATEASCAHHWHLRAHGWGCCWCPEAVRRGADAPVSTSAMACARPEEPTAESPRTWLAPPAEDREVFLGIRGPKRGRAPRVAVT